MKHFDEIYEIAADGYGIVTASQAREAGVTSGEMRRWCTDGKLVRRGHGLYPVGQLAPYALRRRHGHRARVDEGEPVHGQHGLAP